MNLRPTTVTPRSVPAVCVKPASGLVKNFKPSGYPTGAPMVPHGMSVIVNSPSVFRHTAAGSSQRHLDGASWLGADIAGASTADAGDVLADQLIVLMRATNIPNGLKGVGYDSGDIASLVEGALPQRRLLDNAPVDVDRETLTSLFEGALRYW